jgi:hypothetical protein
LGKWFVFLFRRPERAAQTPKIGFKACDFALAFKFAVQCLRRSKVQQLFNRSTLCIDKLLIANPFVTFVLSVSLFTCYRIKRQKSGKGNFSAMLSNKADGYLLQPIQTNNIFSRTDD